MAEKSTSVPSSRLVSQHKLLNALQTSEKPNTPHLFRPNAIPCDTSNSDASLDSDLFSISDSITTSLENSKTNEFTNSVFKEIFSQLLSNFRSTTPGIHNGAKCDNGDGSTSRTPIVGRPFGGNKNRPSRKRKQGDNEDHDNNKSPRRPAPQNRAGDVSQKPFACPYLKLDPVNFMCCCPLKLTRIRDVKLHLARRHTAKWYCQRCKLTSFDNEEALEIHLREGTCQYRDESMLDGVSLDKQRRLSQRSNPAFSKEDQWYTIWDILFPGQPRPSSVYVEPELSPYLTHLREFCYVRGSVILGRLLYNDPPPPPPNPMSEIDGWNSAYGDVWRRHIERLNENWVTEIFREWRHSHSQSSLSAQYGILGESEQGTSLPETDDELTQQPSDNSSGPTDSPTTPSYGIQSTSAAPVFTTDVSSSDSDFLTTSSFDQITSDYQGQTSEIGITFNLGYIQAGRLNPAGHLIDSLDPSVLGLSGPFTGCDISQLGRYEDI
jgi:hypothetical protein